MAYVVPPGFSRVNFVHAPNSPNGSDVVWGFGCDASPGPTICEALLAWWQDSLAPLTATTATLRAVTMRNDASYFETPTNVAGELSATFAAPNTAALVKLTTGLVGRGNRGRIFLPGVIPEGSIGNDGILAFSLVEDLQASLTDLAGVLDVFNATFQILHSTSSDPTQVTAYQVQDVAATQRRRLRR